MADQRHGKRAMMRIAIGVVALIVATAACVVVWQLAAIATGWMA